MDFQMPLFEQIKEWGVNVLSAFLLLLVGYYLARFASSLLKNMLKKAKVAQIVTHFLASLLFAALLLCFGIAALGALGIETTSLIAILGAAGLAVGLALQGTLANLASGILLILLRPYKVDDYVEAGGEKGLVVAIDLFHTLLRSPDNRALTIPNSKIFSNNIHNYQKYNTRRLDLSYTISYDDDLKKAKAVLARIAETHPKILKEPVPYFGVGELGQHGVEVLARPWTKTEDALGVSREFHEEVFYQFKEAGLHIAYPQLDVRVCK